MSSLSPQWPQICRNYVMHHVNVMHQWAESQRALQCWQQRDELSQYYDMIWFFLIKCLMSVTLIFQSHHPDLLRIEDQGPVMFSPSEKQDRCQRHEALTDTFIIMYCPCERKPCFVSSLDTMWQNTDDDDDRDPSALRQKKNTHKHLYKFYSEKSFQAWEAAGKVLQQHADKHNYYQFRSSSFKCFLNHEACS